MAPNRVPPIVVFERLATVVARYWVWVLLVWTLLVLGLRAGAPDFASVTHDGDFAYLPPAMTSVRGEALLDAAFPEALSKSQVVVVAARGDGRLTDEDFSVIDRVVDRFSPEAGNEDLEAADEIAAIAVAAGPIVGVWSYRSPVVGEKLVSPAGTEGQAALVVLRLRSEFMAIDNMPLLREIDAALEDLRGEEGFPAGLELAVTGSAAVGSDMLFAAEESIGNTERTTVALVVLILLLVYRAPGLLVVPLVTIIASVAVATDVVALLAQAAAGSAWFDFMVFRTTRIFIIVILFGAGTDYCLFLIARYKEELRRGLDREAALAGALANVGQALAASALTTIVGLGMMFFADFGKFSNSGPAIALCLAVALLASVTLAPGLLRAGGRFVFWPFGPASEAPTAAPEAEGGRSGWFWKAVARGVVARPGLVLVSTVLLLAPLAWRGSSVAITYDLVSELGADRPSVRGTHLLRRYFLPGETGPVTVVAFDPAADFDAGEDRNRISLLTKELYELTYRDSEGRLVQPVEAVRSLTEPLGDVPGSFNPLSSAGRRKLFVIGHPRTRSAFVSQSPGLEGRVTRIDLVFRYDPFSPEAVRLLEHVERHLADLAADPGSPWGGTQFDFVGTTAGIRDLAAVTASDQRLIQQLVVLAVLAVLVLILRHPVVCVYLILSVLFGYFVTIGATEALFARIYGESFHGLDWKVPIFLFVILIAVGQDYNIYLVTRVFEEQRRLGPLEGLRVALVRTGGIITSCGVIMAGTFASMLAGSLKAMHELGFALALGVLLDTFVIRTVLVPAFLALWFRRTARQGEVAPEPAEAHDSHTGSGGTSLERSAAAR